MNKAVCLIITMDANFNHTCTYVREGTKNGSAQYLKTYVGID